MTEITFSPYEDEPDITVTFNINAPKGIWEKVKFVYSAIFKGTELLLTYNFKDGEQVKETISLLNAMLDEESFNVMKALPEAILPTKAHPGDVGWDLYTPKDFRLNPGETKRINFGIVVEIKPGYEIQVRNRSSIVWKYSTMMALGTGTVDTYYRGAILAPFYNFGREQVRFKRGDRIAQMVIKKIEDVALVEGDVNTNTERGSNGYGSSGK